MDDEITLSPISLQRRRLDRVNYNKPCLVAVAGPSVGERFPLSKPAMIIGRQSEADIPILDSLISRKHAEIITDGDGRNLLRDLGSRNGTLCNDRKVTEIILKDGDFIRLGNTILKFVGPNSLEHVYLERMSERAERDGLTGLYNQQVFHVYLQRSLSRCRDLGEPLSVAMIDLDWFKKINDTWGHLAGDFVLKEFAAVVKNGTRPTDLLARYGGEEFGLILPHTNVKEGGIAGERIRNRVAGHAFVYNGRTLPVTISVGIAERTEEVEDAEAFIARADKALYQAKKEGRNRTCLFIEPSSETDPAFRMPL